MAQLLDESDLDFQQIDRRRQLAAMLQQDAMSPIQNANPGGMYASAISPFQGAQKLLAGYLAGKSMGNADRDQRNVLLKRNQAIADALSDLHKPLNRAAAPGNITMPPAAPAPAVPGDITAAPPAAPPVGPEVRALPQQSPVIPDEQMAPGLASMHQVPLEPNKLVFGPNTEPMPKDIVPPTTIGGEPQDKPETFAEYAARVRIAANQRGVNPLTLMQYPEVAMRFQQLLDMEKEGRAFTRDMDKMNNQDALTREMEKYKRSLTAGDIKDTITAQDGTIYGRKADGSLMVLGNAGQDPNKLVQIGPDGKPMVNQTAVDAQSKVRAAGRNSVSVSVGGKDFKGEMDLRKEFRDAPVSKAYNEAKIALDQVRRALNSKSAIGDVAASTKIMKLLDPPSVVRESELWVAMNSAGVVDRFTNMVNYWATGQRLTDQQRKEFATLGEQLFKAYEGAYKAHENEYRQTAREWGINERRIVGSDSGPAAGGPKAGSGWKIEEVK